MRLSTRTLPHRRLAALVALALGFPGCVTPLGDRAGDPPCDMVGDEIECHEYGEYGTTSAELRVSGAWRPDDGALRASDAWTLRYDDAPAWDASRCSGNITPGGQALRTDLRARFPAISAIGGYSCRRNTGATSRMSVHGTGRALDIMVPTIGGDADNTTGDAIAHWLMVNSRDIGVQLIIWDRAVWNPTRAPGTRVRPYGGPIPHVDHLHVELTIPAGRRETPFFGGAPPVDPGGTTEPPPPLVDHPDPVAACGSLQPNEVLDHDESVSSCDGRFALVHQADGNVVLYGADGRARWSTETYGRASSFLVMQGDGNLVLYDRWLRPLWASGTPGHAGAWLAMQDDGNVVIVAGHALWSTGTAEAAPAPAPAPPPPPPPPPPTPPPPPPTACGVLPSGAALGPGDAIQSCDGRFALVHQTDGNVVLYSSGAPLWSSRTPGRATSALVMQTDGNLVLYGAGGAALWDSGTHGNAGAVLAVQDDANLVVYGAGGRPLWDAWTAERAR